MVYQMTPASRNSCHCKVSRVYTEGLGGWGEVGGGGGGGGKS